MQKFWLNPFDVFSKLFLGIKDKVSETKFENNSIIKINF